ncbi:MAG: phosphotransferase family protein [Alphaproteobacteria bacterium]
MTRERNAAAPPIVDATPKFHPAASETPQDWPALSSHLAAHGLRFDPEANPPRQFATGYGNLNYLIVVDGATRVLRRPPMGKLPPGANDMRREHTILSAIAPVFPLAPRSLYHTMDDSVIGAQFMIMEYRPGLSIGGRLPPAVAAIPGIGRKLGGRLVDVLATIHAIEPEAVGLGAFGKPEGFLARTAAGWRKRLMIATDDAPTRAAVEVADWLDANLVPEGPATLIHNDFKLDNVLLDPTTLEPVAVIDWDQGTRADPLFDLATMLSYWAEPSDPEAMLNLEQMPTAAHGFPRRREVVETYARLSGRDVSNILFHRVLAMLKLGVIFAQIHARYRRGESADERYARFGPIVDGLFAFAHDISRGRAF